jgi:hypothetical protein
MKILIVEPELRGHFVSLYVRNIVKSLNKQHQIYFLTSKRINKTKLLNLIVQENKNLKLLYCNELSYGKKKNNFSLFFNQIKNFIYIKNKIIFLNKKFKFDEIFFSNLDHFDKSLCFFKNPFDSLKFSGILVNPRVHQFKNKKIYRFKYFLYKFFINKLFSINYLKKALVNDVLFLKYLDKKKINEKVIYFNEPVIREKKHKIIKNIFVKNSLNILVYGAIRTSKSLEELVELTGILKLKIDINIIVAGKQDNDIKKILHKVNLVKKNVYSNFKIINRFIEPKEESYLFSKSDAVWCVYKNTPLGSSGVFHLSMNYKIPIITNDLGLIGWYNKKYNVGPILRFDEKKYYINSANKIIDLYKNVKKYNFYKSNQSKLLKYANKQKKFDKIINDLF